MKLLKNKKFIGKIVVKTGLHIGGSAERIEIGGVDNPVIKNPATDEPYIPGSSLKGKMRSLMEWKLGKVTNGDVHVCRDESEAIKCPICRIFGVPVDNKNPFTKLGPTRLITRDAFLTESCRNEWKQEGRLFTEFKSENILNRVTAKATPRDLERVIPGAEFDLELVYRIFDMGDGGSKDEEFFNYVVQALKCVQDDVLGGSGSRGCGKIEFVDLKDENGKSISL